jgi:hypothetical protein
MNHHDQKSTTFLTQKVIVKTMTIQIMMMSLTQMNMKKLKLNQRQSQPRFIKSQLERNVALVVEVVIVGNAQVKAIMYAKDTTQMEMGTVRSAMV